MNSKYDPLRHHRRSIRLNGYDYTKPGPYFVTLCEQGFGQSFGDIMGGRVDYSKYGQIVADCWEWLESQYDYVVLDEWRVMPDHMHGIIVMTDGNTCRGGSRTAPTGNGDVMATARTAPTRNSNSALQRKTLGRIVGAFKTITTKRVNAIRNSPGIPLWQRDFWDRIIRDDDELNRIRDYIRMNPHRWGKS